MRNNFAGIVMPSYNQHPFLAQAIDSVLSQTHKDFCLTIVNDYCGYDSDEKRQELAKIVSDRDDSRIQLFHNEKNLGIPKSRNRAIKILLENGASSIFFLDHDDIWSSEEKLREQISILSKGEIWLIWTQFDFIDRTWRVVGNSLHPRYHDDMVKNILFSCPILMSSLWVQASILRDNWMLDETVRGSDDWVFLMRNLKKYKWENLQQSMIQYRLFWENTSVTQWHALIRERMRVLKREWKNYPSYHQALLFWYSQLLVPQKYKDLFRPIKRLLLNGLRPPAFKISDEKASCLKI